MLMALSLASAVLFSPAVAAKEYSPGYWDRTYGTAETPAVTYSLSLQVQDVHQALAKIEKRLAKLGGSLVKKTSSAALQSQTVAYATDLAGSEAAAKGLFDLGEVRGYSSQRLRGPREAEELRERLAELTSEKESNAECVSKMPIAAYFLDSRIAQLKQAVAASEAGALKASIEITLTEQAPKPKP
jgi:hypothetical protein